MEQGLTSHQTHYRSYQGQVLRVKWPNQQCRSTEGRKCKFIGRKKNVIDNRCSPSKQSFLNISLSLQDLRPTSQSKKWTLQYSS